jgi:hypothetical protein
MFYYLDHLKSTAMGLDNLPSWFLKISAPFIALPVSQLFNLSINASVVPQQWKKALIVPIPKISVPSVPVDFRPISITSILSRLMEKLFVRRFLYPAFAPNYINCHPSLRFQKQFAFVPTGSTTAALIAILHAITTRLETEPYVRMISLDFSKAFDTVRHSQLVSKASRIIPDDHALNWLGSYLEDHSHCTKYDGIISALAPINASVIQGSAIGPASFAVVAADLIPFIPNNDLYKYADDMYLIVSASDSKSCTDELNHISDWAATNNLKLNNAKSREIIFFKSRRRLNSTPQPPPTMNLEQVTTIKILGVTLCSDLTITTHIDITLTSCAQSLFALKTLRAHGMPYHSICDVYRATTLSKIVYASPAWWGFTTAADRQRLEAFLNKSKKMKLYGDNEPTISALCTKADDALFRRITTDPNHVLHYLLPPPAVHVHNLRPRRHNFSLPPSAAPHHQNFFSRQLYKDSY